MDHQEKHRPIGLDLDRLRTVTSVADIPASALSTAVTLYGASSDEVDPVFKDAARELGRLVARAGMPMVSGGGCMGLMGAAIEGAAGAGGVTIGVLPAFMVERRWDHPRLSVTLPVADMHTRKAVMAALAAGVVAMPGGIGTFDELFEIVTWRQLGLWHGRIVILDTAGYYRPLLDMLSQAESLGFMRRRGATSEPLYHVASDPAEAMSVITG